MIHNDGPYVFIALQQRRYNYHHRRLKDRLDEVIGSPPVLSGEWLLPYHKQGDENFYTPVNTQKRMALKTDARVITQLERFWSVLAAPRETLDRPRSRQERFGSIFARF